MAELEQIKGTDIASEAIKKLDRNIKAVNLELEEGGTGPSIELVDNLNEENPGKALDARQGKILNINKVDKTQIKNNLTETVAGNVLDATQGKALKELLDELRTGRGYLTTVVADGADFDTLINNGKYKINNGTNKPDDSTSSTFLLDVTMMNSLYIYQQAACLYSNAGNTGRVFYRFKLNNIWQPWNRIPTMAEMQALPQNLINTPIEE
jgi:hypothetical protein